MSAKQMVTISGETACLVAKTKCCSRYFAACVIREASDLTMLFEFIDECSLLGDFEFKPVSFVRNGGLDFENNCPACIPKDTEQAHEGRKGGE